MTQFPNFTYSHKNFQPADSSSGGSTPDLGDVTIDLLKEALSKAEELGLQALGAAESQLTAIIHRYLQNYSVISTFSRFGCFSGDKVSALDLAVS